ncbi:MAG: galactokinase [Clostridia bacterium]|nr:galactokinase [Clostridia bacterium]
MKINEMIQQIRSGAFDTQFLDIYGETETPKNRFTDACEAFKNLFGDLDNIRIFSAPGRTEIGGNHTDHQHGRVLAGSVNLDVIAIVSETDQSVIHIKSAGYDMDTVDINSLSVQPKETGRSSALIRGVCAAFRQNGKKIGGFDAYTTSNVLKGSGLSSSAAFEVLVASILNGLFNDASVSPIDLAKYSQFAEREYFGKPCGLLDQMASSMGGFTYADFMDPANPVVEKVAVDVHRNGYTLCVVDTGGNHANLTQDYADITLECRAVSNALGVDFLRDADQERFYREMADLRKSCGDRAVLRAFHFFHEDQRAVKQFEALKNDWFDEFLRLVNASGNSSFENLQNLYSTSNTAEQGLVLALCLTKEFLDGDGACRVHGGGFAGTIQCYIPNERFSAYKTMIESVFGKDSCIPIMVRPVGGYEFR